MGVQILGDVTAQLPSVYVSRQQRHWWVRPSVRLSVRPSFIIPSLPLSPLSLPRFAPLSRNDEDRVDSCLRLPRSVGVFSSTRSFSQIWLIADYQSKYFKTLFYTFGYLLELCIEIWRFFRKLWFELWLLIISKSTWFYHFYVFLQLFGYIYIL
jgi:hypothetical protein